MATKPRRQTLRRRGRKKPKPRLKLDPDLWGMLLGAFTATLILAVDYYRDPGTPLGFHIVIGAGLGFVISYVSAAIFVWYLRLVRERELENATPPATTHLGSEEIRNQTVPAETPAAGEGS